MIPVGQSGLEHHRTPDRRRSERQRSAALEPRMAGRQGHRALKGSRTERALHNPAGDRQTAPHRGPFVTPDNPRRRCKGSDRRWSCYERPLDAVDLTECAGYVERITSPDRTCPAGLGAVRTVPGGCPHVPTLRPSISRRGWGAARDRSCRTSPTGTSAGNPKLLCCRRHSSFGCLV